MCIVRPLPINLQQLPTTDPDGDMYISRKARAHLQPRITCSTSICWLCPRSKLSESLDEEADSDHAHPHLTMCFVDAFRVCGLVIDICCKCASECFAPPALPDTFSQRVSYMSRPPACHAVLLALSAIIDEELGHCFQRA